jgi:hypothetical protein
VSTAGEENEHQEMSVRRLSAQAGESLGVTRPDTHRDMDMGRPGHSTLVTKPIVPLKLSPE